MYITITTIEEYEDFLNLIANHRNKVGIVSIEKYNNEIVVEITKTISGKYYPNPLDNPILNFLSKKVYERRKKMKNIEKKTSYNK